jgi:uracil-DNA glycosylase
MTDAAWTAFVAAREEYRAAVARLSRSLPELREAQQRLVDEREGGSFPVETPVVYNGAVDDVGPGDDISIILVADNPGRREQAAENRRYLVGPSGKLADGFFRSDRAGRRFSSERAHPEQDAHPHPPNRRTPGTREPRRRPDRPRHSRIPREMVSLIRSFHEALNLGRAAPVQLWIIGYSELGRGKLFWPFADALGKAYAPEILFAKASWCSGIFP